MVLLALVLWLVPAVAEAGSRIALIIGNSDYQNTSKLANPRRDAEAMAQTLSGAGFSVTSVIDADFQTMRRALIDFGRSLRGPDIEAGLFFYAGHGVQVEGENYLVPVTAKITSEDEVDLEAINVNDFLRVMNSSDSRINIVVLDACRDNPFAQSFRSMSRGLAPADAPKGTLIAYSTAPGDVAEDGSGTNSPYTSALIEAIRAGRGQPIENVFKQARRDVLKSTQDRQVPWEVSSITGDFYFLPGDGAPQAAADPAPEAATTEDTSDSRSADPIAEKFEMARKVGSAGAWKAFLGQYGEDAGNFYVAMAREELAALEPATPEPVTPQSVTPQADEPPAEAAIPLPEGVGQICSKARFDAGPARVCVTSVLDPQFGNRYGAVNLTDGSLKTAWVEGRKGDGIGELLSIEFEKPVALSEVALINGYSKSQDIFAKNNRVEDITIVTSTGISQTLRLADLTDWQDLGLRSDQPVKWITLKISSVYRGSKYRDTAISELRLR